MSTLNKNSLRRSAALVGAAAIAVGGLAGCSAEEEEFPSDTIEMIIPYGAGGSTDVSLRLMSQIAEDTCGTDFIASNQTGSAGAVGFTATADADPDGYTIGATAHEIAILFQMGTAEIKPADVKPILRYALNPHVIFVPADSPYETFTDLVEAAESGTKINVATAGTGSAAHLSLVGLSQELGLDDAFVNLPFDGDGPAVQALVGGQADMTMLVAGTAMPFVESGDLRPLAVAGEESIAALPDTGTLIDEGIDWTSGAHLGLVAPLDTPDDRIEYLDECLHEAIESDEFQEGMADQGFEVAYMPHDEFGGYLQELVDLYGPIIKNAGVAG